jgi:fatty-acyl-CoA synthase
VIAFGAAGRKGKERVVVVAETRATDFDRIRDEVGARSVETVGVPCREVVLVQPGTLPKTSSGKLQRRLCRQQYLRNELALAGTGGV